MNLIPYVFVENLPYLKLGFGQMYFLVHFNMFGPIYCTSLRSLIVLMYWYIPCIGMYGTYQYIDIKKNNYYVKQWMLLNMVPIVRTNDYSIFANEISHPLINMFGHINLGLL
jgi:hypothetical protein